MLKTDIDPERRSMNLKLLLAEEQRLGDYSEEHLAALDRHIAGNHERIARQRTIIDQLNGDGQECIAKSAQKLLDTLTEVQAAYQEHRARIQDNILK